jgi:hypothetical protein
LFAARRRHHNNKIARGDDDETPDGGFGGAQDAQEMVVQTARQRRRHFAVGQTGHGEQRRDDAQKRVAVAGNHPSPVHGYMVRFGVDRHGREYGSGFAAFDEKRMKGRERRAES